MGVINKLTIKSKLMLMLLVVSICSIIVISYLGYSSGQKNLTERIFNQLTSLRASKTEQIESYFTSLRNQTEVFSENLTIIAAIQEFTAGYQELDTISIPPNFEQEINSYYQQEFLPRLTKTTTGLPILESYTPTESAAKYLQYYYLVTNPNPVGKKHLLNDAGDGSKYSKVHSLYHPIFHKIVEKFGYYDMFLIDSKGAIVYSVFKETDFGTNLNTGPYNETNLAKAATIIRQAKGREYIKIEDFQPYSPSYGAPAAFIAAPIYQGAKFLGVLAFQFPVDEINKVMTGNRNWEKKGLGKTGEIYLVGEDYLMRSVSRFLIEDEPEYLADLSNIGVKEETINKIKNYGTSILQQQVKTLAVKEALTGKEGTKIIEDYRGIPVLSSYSPLNIEDLNWVILSEIDLAEAYLPVYSFQKRVLVSTTVIMLINTLVAMGLANIFVKPINSLITCAPKVGEGNMDTLIILESQDEFGELAESFNQMITSLRQQTEIIEKKNQENEKLLLSIFPSSVAKRLKRGEKEIADNISNVTVLFSDLTGFTELSQSMTAAEAVGMLNSLVTAFDEATEIHGMEKIKTIGDGYMAVCGLSLPRLDHDKRAIDFALEMFTIVRRINREKGLKLNLRIGINSGDVVAGIVGTNKFLYDVWGDTINVASALKSACPIGAILVGKQIRDRLQDLYNFEPVGDIRVSEKQVITVWKLNNEYK